MAIRFFGLCWSAVILLAPAAGAAQQAQLPNLKALPAFDLALEPNGSGGELIVFSTLTWNSGDGALELVAGETGTDADGNGIQTVYHRVYRSDGSHVDYPAGTFAWHPAHNHFHFGNYALYTLQLSGAAGESQQLPRTGSKTTFCVLDTDRIDHRLPGASKKRVYKTCSATVQGMSVGWGDQYSSYLAGQEIDVTGLSDDIYTLEIEVDPMDRLDEINESDNTSCVLLNISVSSMTVAVEGDGSCGATGGEVTVSEIAPYILYKGTVTSVVITGTGFTDGIDVSFAGGSGPRPNASEINVVAPTTIEAFVTVKAGGPAGTQDWDVQVGSGTLPYGLTVLP